MEKHRTTLKASSADNSQVSSQKQGKNRLKK